MFEKLRGYTLAPGLGLAPKYNLCIPPLSSNARSGRNMSVTFFLATHLMAAAQVFAQNPLKT
jgi:hypothetical protein